MPWTRPLRWTVLCLCLATAPAAAQSTVISAALDVNVTRSGGSEGAPSFSRLPTVERGSEGAALGGSGSIAHALGERWGVAFEVGVSGTIEATTRVNAGPIFFQDLDPLPGSLLTPVPLPFPIPDFEFSQTNTTRYTTLTPLAWVRIPAGQRVAIDVSGGLSFARVRVRRTIDITDRRLALFGFPTELTTIDYTVGPAIGASAEVRLTDRVAPTGGMRLHAFSLEEAGVWLLRPQIGARYRF